MKKSISKDQRGLGHVLVVVLILIVIAGVGFGAWRVLNKNKTNTSSTGTVATAQTSAAESSCNSVYHDANLCKFAATATDFSKTSYSATGTTTSSQGTENFSMKSDGKGNYSISSTVSGQAFDVIEIGTAEYIKSGSTWMKYTSSAPAVTNPSSNVKFDFSQSSTPATQKIQYKALGTETVNGVECYKYQVVDPSSPGTTQYFWISTSDYSMQQWYTKDSNGTTQLTFTYNPVTITAPSPATNVSASGSSSTSSGSNSGLTAAEQAQIQAEENQAKSSGY